MDIETRLTAFIEEANELANSYAQIGQDDSSYEAGRIADQVEMVLLTYVSGRASPQEAEKFLTKARMRLDSVV